MHNISPTMTDRRKLYLERLVKNGICHKRGKGPTGYYCMQLGWTEWVRVESGRVIGERITEAGREALKQAGGEL